jgi:hypothetical protein
MEWPVLVLVLASYLCLFEWYLLTLFHAALGLLAQAYCDLTPHKEE